MASVQGDLAQVGVGALLVLVEMEKKTGVLALRRMNGQTAAITIRDGKVLRAEMRGSPLVDAECIYHLLRWKSGRFDFAACDTIDAEDRIAASTTHLLMEGARRADEDSVPVRLARGTQAPPPDDADEWSEDTPLMLAAKLAELVQLTARSALPPLAVPQIPEPVVAPAPARRVHHARWLAAIAVCAAAGVAAPWLAEPGAPDTAWLQGDATLLASAIDTAAGAARAHAKTLAATPLLRAGIETDAPTIQDLADHEGLFATTDGATIEVFQLHGDTPVSMVRRPATAPPLPAAADDNPRLASDGHALLVVASAPIARQSAGVGGVLALGLPCDLSAISSVLARHALGATLVGLDHPLVLVARSGDGTPVTLPVGANGLLLAAVVPAPAASRSLAVARAGLWGLASLLLGLYGFALRRREP